MNPTRGRTDSSREAGFALVEVMVSALIAVIMTGAVVGVLNASGRSGAEDRHRTQAFSLAQEDQARMRGMRISTLNGYNNTRAVTVNGTEYTVHSTASFVNDKTSNATCEEGKASADYVKTASEVSWQATAGRHPTTTALASIITPPNGSLDPTHGTLTFRLANAAGTPISGVKLETSGTGNPSTFSVTTDSTGCAILADRLEGNYSVKATNLAAGYIDEEGNAPVAKSVGLTGNGTTEVQWHYDKEAGVKAAFTVKPYVGTTPVAAKADSMMLIQNQWKGSQEKLIGTPGGTRQTFLTANALFPFTSSAYSAYAGGCAENNPKSGAGIASVTLASGAIETPITLQLPALDLTVKRKEKNGEVKPLSGGAVTIKEEKCGSPVKRTYTTNASGQLPEPEQALPYGTYTVCASAQVTILKEVKNKGKTEFIEETATRHEGPKAVEVHELTGTTLNMELSEADPEGLCP